MKILASIIVVILLLCGGALWFLAGGSLNEFVKAQIETVGKQVTEQTVSVKTVDIKLTEGAGSILGLNIANPQQYSQPNLFTLDEITLDINLESLTGQPVIIDAIVIKDPQAFVQVTSSGGSNIQEILKAIEKNIPKTSGASEKQSSDSSQQEVKIAVHKVVLAGTQLSLDLSALGNKEHQVMLPDINLENIGGSEGLPASQLGSEILKQALSSIWKNAKSVQKKKLVDKAKDKLKDKAKKKLSELFS